MIEVEKKFLAGKGDIARITAGATLTETSINDDTYYDTPDFSLTKKDWYLRKRNGAYELKIGIRREGFEGLIDTYEEIGDEEEITRRLGMQEEKSLEENLRQGPYAPFGSWRTTRLRYRVGEFSIDVDSVDYGYEVVEVERVVESDDEMEVATKAIFNFAAERGLTESPPTGKVSEFLRRTYPSEYEEIKEAWSRIGKKH